MRKGNILLVILVSVAVVATSVGGYFWWSSQTKPPASVETSQNKPADSSKLKEATPSADETVNWKTYVSFEQKIEFKYPAMWDIKGLAEKTFFILLSPTKVVIPNGTDAPLGPITIGLNECIDTRNGQKSPCETSLDELLNNYRKFKEESDTGSIPLKYENFQISGSPAVKIINAPRSIKQIVVPHGKYLLIVNLTNPDLENLFDQILSTFKFLDQNSGSGECQLCGPKGIHNVEGETCPTGLVCKTGETTSLSYCVIQNESTKKCEAKF